MNLEQYLNKKYGKNVAALTSIEARHFGIPYPLISGWEKRHGKMNITPGMAERVSAAFQKDTVKAGSKKFRERALQILESIVEIETPSAYEPVSASTRVDGRTLRKSNRTVQFATRVTGEFDARLREIAQRDELMLVEVLEKALDAYEAVRLANGVSHG